MGDAESVKIYVKPSVLDLGAVVTADVLDLDAIVRDCSIGEPSEDIMHFSLVKDYMHPCVSRIVINNYEAI